jgi:16S rRNA G966 N2-methylase RsmD
MVRLAELRPNPRNPNEHPAEQVEILAKVIAHQGWRAPIVVSTRSGLVVSGHGRLEAAKLLKLDKVPVDYQAFKSDDDEMAHLLADNQIAELAEIDADELKEIIAGLDSSFDKLLTGFDEHQLENFQNNEAALEPRFKEAEKLLAKWKVKRGQMWKLGEHKLLCGDALAPEVWERLGGPFQFCFADPPYELPVNPHSLRMAGAGTFDLCMMATDKTFLTCDGQYFRTFFVHTYGSASVALWDTAPLRQHTLIGWWRFGERKQKFHSLTTLIKGTGKNQEAGQNHEQAKSVSIPAHFLPWFTKKGEAFADAFSGSGTSLIAAHRLSRRAMSVELLPKNCAVILQRFQDETGVVPELEGIGK